MYNTAGTDTEGHGTVVASVAAGYDNFTNADPYEIVKCIRDATVTTNLCDGVPWPNCSSCLGICQTNVSVCLVYTNSGGSGLFPTPDPFAAQISHRDDYYIGNTNGLGFQLGLGVSPFGRIGASLGGANGGGGPGEISAAYLLDARISNNSWGEGLLIGVNDGVYNLVARAYDALVRDAVTTGGTNGSGETPLNQEMSIVFAAGNGNGIGGAGGYGETLITPPGTAKNVITVGASKNLHLGFRVSDVDNSFDIADFSSFGPTRDGRFKPEIVAPGSGISGALSQGTYTQPPCFGCDPNNPGFPHCAASETLYPTITSLYGVPSGGVAVYYGTSFSAPAVSGGIQLLWWWFQNHLLNEQGQHLLQPSPAMAKAYLLSSARYLPIADPQHTNVMDTLPSIAQGMGIMDLARMFDSVPRVLRDETTPRALSTPLLTTNPVPQQAFFSRLGQSYEVSGQVASNDQPFRVTLSWTDAPGDPNASKALVNDLDLEVTMVNSGVTNVYRGNQFVGPNSVTADPSRLPDDVNNTESVFLPADQTGPWSVVVRAITINGNGVPHINTDVGQDFALVVYNATNPSDTPTPGTNDTCQTALSITNFSPGFTFSNQLTNTHYSNVHPSPSAATGGIEEFFKIPLPQAGTMFSVTSSSSNAVLSIWRGNCGALVEVSSEVSLSTNVPATLDFAADGAEDYYIIVDGLNGGNADVQLNVSRTIPVVTVLPSSLNFSNQMVGTTSTPAIVSINASGSNTVTVTSVVLGGHDPSYFIISTNPCIGGATILPGDSCSLNISFAPTDLAARTAVLTVVTSGPVTNTVSLTGNGVPAGPVVATSPLMLTYGDQSLGTTSAVQSVTVTNVGTAALIINGVGFSSGNPDDFVVVSNTCLGASIPTNGICTINVSFVPKAVGPRATYLQILSNAGSGTNTVFAMGFGIAPVISLSAPSLNFGTQLVSVASAPLTVAVQSVGDSPLLISSVTVVGTNAGDFAVTANPCLGVPITPGNICGISVSFTPSALGNRTAALRIVSNATNTPPVDVPLTGVGGMGVPSIGFDPTSLLFGDGVVGTTGTVQLALSSVTTSNYDLILYQGIFLTVTNRGTAALVISGLSFSGGDSNDFVVEYSDCLGAGIAPGGSCLIKVDFAPTTNGVRSSVLRVLSNSGTGTNDLPVAGTGLTESFTVTPASMSFGSQPVGIVSAPEWLVVQNTGEAPVMIQGVAVWGTNATDFVATLGNCARPQTNGACLILAGESTAISAAFTPSTLGTRTATMGLTEWRFVGPGVTNPLAPVVPFPPGPFGSTSNGYVTVVTKMVPLSGIGTNTAPSLGCTPSSLTFGDQLVGTTSAVQQVTVTNAGNAALIISGVGFSTGNTGDFLAVGTTCLGSPILPNGACSIGVASAPTTSGLLNTRLRILSNSGPGTNDVLVSGSGIAPVMTLSTNSLDFGSNTVNTASQPQSLFVLNSGNAALSISGVTLSGVNPGDFRIALNGCLGADLSPGKSCEIDLSFLTTTTLPRAALLTITSTAANSPQVVTLSGTGAPPAPSVCASGALFGDQFVGTTSKVHSVTITNCGTATLFITNIVSSTSEYIVSSGACSNDSILAGGTCAFGVSFAPTNSGSRSGTLTINDNALGSPHHVSLSGTGVPPVPLVCVAGTLAFGNQFVGSTSSESVTITNCGLGTLVVSNAFITGVNSNDFAIVTPPSCPSVVPNGACNIGITFAPTTNGLRTAQLVITNSAPSSPDTVSLSGTGVGCAPFTIYPSVLPSPTLGIPYPSQNLTASGATLPVTFALAIGSTPGVLLPGLSLSTSGVISGTATAPGVFSFKVGVTDTNGCAGDKWYTVNVICPTITIAPSALPSGQIGMAYSQTITATGGVSPYAFAQTGGSLPAGMSLSTAGVLSGTPTSVSSVFTVTATDTNGCQGSRSYTITLADPLLPPPAPAPQPIIINPTSLPAATQGQSYNQQLMASGGTGSLSFSVAGSLPAGVTISSLGVLSGTPATNGTFNFTVTASDTGGHVGTHAYTLTVSSTPPVSCPTITVTPGTLPTGTVSSVYSQTLSASGGAAPYIFTKTGALPAGLTLSSAGTLSGTPSGAGQFNFTVTATDANSCTGSRACSLVVNNPPVVSASVDLRVSVTANLTNVSVLSNVTYTVVVTNAGPATATGVTLADTLTPGARLVLVVPSQGSYTQSSAGAISFSLGTLSAGGSAQATVVVEANKVGTLTNSATVAANESDSNMANNSAVNSTVAVVSDANVDLTGTRILVVQTGKQSAKPVYSITAKLTCSNQGLKTSPAAVVRFFLSSTSSLAPDALRFGKDLSTGKLKAGKKRQLTFRAKLPVGTNAKGLYVIAVIDPGNLVAETDKTNNTIVMGQIP